MIGASDAGKPWCVPCAFRDGRRRGDTRRAMSTTKNPASDLAPLLTAMLNMTAFHHEHEKFYSTAPREQAVALQRHSRTLHALADQWTITAPATTPAFSP